MKCETVENLAAMVEGRVVGDRTRTIRGVADLRTAGPEHASFVRDAQHAGLAAQSCAGCVIVPEPIEGLGTQIVATDPHAAFARIALFFHPAPTASRHAVHPSAVIDPEAVLEEPVEIGPQVSVGRGSRVGAGTVLGAGVVLGEQVTVGRQCSIFPRVVLYDRVTLGDRVVVHAGTVIGSDGFGYARQGPSWIRVPQIGDVVIEDDVEIGANVAIDRGALGSTRIGRGTKIDNIVHVGHNCRIGADCAIAAFSAFAGTTIVGDRCTIAGHVITKGHIRIADDVRIGGNSGVTTDLETAGDYMGYPIQSKRRWIRTLFALERLPELMAQLRRAARGGDGS